MSAAGQLYKNERHRTRARDLFNDFLFTSKFVARPLYGDESDMTM